MSLFFDIPITHNSGVNQIYGKEQMVAGLKLYFAEGQYYRLVKYHLNAFEPMNETVNDIQLYTLTLDVVLSRNQSVETKNATSIDDITQHQLTKDEVISKVTMFRVLGNRTASPNDGYVERYLQWIFRDRTQGIGAQWYTLREIDPKRYFRIYLPDDVNSFAVDLTYNRESSRVIIGPTGKEVPVLTKTEVVTVPYQRDAKLIIRGDQGPQYLLDTSVYVRNDIANNINCSVTFKQPAIIDHEATETSPVSLKQVKPIIDAKVQEGTDQIRSDIGQMQDWFQDNIGSYAERKMIKVYGHATGGYFSYQNLRLWINDNEFYFAVAKLASKSGDTKWCMRKFKKGDVPANCSNNVQANFVKQEGDIELTILLPNTFAKDETTVRYYSTGYENPFNPNNYLCLYKGTKQDAELTFKILIEDLPVVRITYDHNVSYCNDIAYIEIINAETNETISKSATINSTVDAKFDSDIVGSTDKVLTYDMNAKITGAWRFDQCPTTPQRATKGDQLVSYNALMSLLSKFGLFTGFTDVKVLIRANFDHTWAQIGYLEIYTTNGRLVPLYMQKLRDNAPIKAVFKWFSNNEELPPNASTPITATTGKTTIVMKDLVGYQLQDNEFFATISLPHVLTPSLECHAYEPYCDPFYRDGYDGLLWVGTKAVEDVYKIEFEDFMHEPVSRVRFKTVRYKNNKAQVIVDYSGKTVNHHDSGEQSYVNDIFDYQIEA